MTTFDIPTAVHFGAADLPRRHRGRFETEGRSWSRLPATSGSSRTSSSPATRYSGTSTGPVYAYTTSGSWRYKEYPDVNRAGSFPV